MRDSRVKHPFLTVTIPTIGRSTLEPLLQGLRHQMPVGDVEILCVGDTFSNTWAQQLASVPALCQSYSARYLEHSGASHAWGHYQRTYAQSCARGRWIWALQDDDGVPPDALATLRRYLSPRPSMPYLFRVDTWQAGRIWRTRELTLGNVDADCLVAPNVRRRLAPWPPHYNGDYEMIRETVALYGGACVWVDAVIAHGRPGGVPADIRAGVEAG